MEKNWKIEVRKMKKKLERKQLKIGTNMKSHPNRKKGKCSLCISHLTFWTANPIQECNSLFKRHDIWLYASTQDIHNTQHSMSGGYVVRGVGWRGGRSDIWYCCYHDNHPGKVSLHNAKQWKKCRKKEFDTLQKTRIWTSHLLTK